MAEKKSFLNPALQFISAAEEPEERSRQDHKGEMLNNSAEKEAAGTTPQGYRIAPEFKTARVQLLIRPTIKNAIRSAAAAQGISLNELIGQILEQYAEGKGLL